MELTRRGLFASIVAAALVAPTLAQAAAIVQKDKYDILLDKYRDVIVMKPLFRDTLGNYGTIFPTRLDIDLYNECNRRVGVLFDHLLTEFPVPKIVATEREDNHSPWTSGNYNKTHTLITDTGERLPESIVLYGRYNPDTKEREYLNLSMEGVTIRDIPDPEVSIALVKHLLQVDELLMNGKDIPQLRQWTQQVKSYILG